MSSSEPAAPHTALALLFGPDQETTAAVAERLRSADIGTDIRGALDSLPPLTQVGSDDLVAAGWQKHADLTAAARRTLAAPGSTDLVDLASHRISTAQEPYVTVLVDGHRVATVRFAVSLAFEISALLAEIKAGKLVALHSGRCVVTGTLAIQDINVVTRQARIDLPGVIALRGGIRLLPVHEYPAGVGSQPVHAT